ncbi:uncharacterized protein LOC110271497 [Arachis ipaensis]|uniref:uncharacterized protein LOC110271497 n=1 Tax=Arachis ipaensis TaxID=130454 RepID=UPI000A2B1C84|nr:uncharacterized protein LOC110271497 [Arachis ipaensis]
MTLDDFLGEQGIHLERKEEHIEVSITADARSRPFPNDGGNFHIPHEEDYLGEHENDNFDVDGDQVMEDAHVEDTPKVKKTSGKTRCLKIYARTWEEREEVTFDCGAAVGPTPQKSKFILPKFSKLWMMTGVQGAWKRYKTRIKKKHFEPYSGNIEDMLVNRPLEIPEVQFRKLIAYWSHVCVNSENRQKQQWRHKMGPINFARVRVDLKKENKEEPNQAEMFVATRNGLKGKRLYVETQAIIDKLDDLEEAGETPTNVFQKVFGKENPGRVRCFGRTLTKT